MEERPNVITIGYAKRALESGSREQKRMLSYATVLGQYHVVVLTRKSEGYPEHFTLDNLTIHATNSANKVAMLLDAFKIVRKILSNEPETHFVVSSQDPFETSLIAEVATLMNHNAIHHVQIHGDVFNKKFFKPSPLNTARIWYAKHAVRSAKKVRVVSHRIKNSLLSIKVRSDRINVVPIQPQLEPFIAVGDTRQYSDTKPIKLLYVGRFSEEKNVEMLIESVATIREQGVPCVLKLLGNGPCKPVYEALVDKRDLQAVVEFLDWTNDVPAVLADADVFCLPSDHEGYGLVLVEAMAAGLPVVTTTVGCVGEVFINKEHGLSVKPGDKGEYVKALKYVCENPEQRSSYGRAGNKVAKALRQSEAVYLQNIRDSFRVAV